MGKALRNRFNGNGEKQEFLRDVEWWGKYEALNLWSDRLDGYKGYGLEDFLEKETGNRNFGINPKVNLYGGTDAFDRFVVALRKFMAKVEATDANNKSLREENEAIKRLLKIKAIQDNNRVLPLIEQLEALPLFETLRVREKEI